jgi:hypothetical protein
MKYTISDNENIMEDGKIMEWGSIVVRLNELTIERDKVLKTLEKLMKALNDLITNLVK